MCARTVYHYEVYGYHISYRMTYMEKLIKNSNKYEWITWGNQSYFMQDIVLTPIKLFKNQTKSIEYRFNPKFYILKFIRGRSRWKATQKEVSAWNKIPFPRGMMGVDCGIKVWHRTCTTGGRGNWGDDPMMGDPQMPLPWKFSKWIQEPLKVGNSG